MRPFNFNRGYFGFNLSHNDSLIAVSNIIESDNLSINAGFVARCII